MKYNKAATEGSVEGRNNVNMTGMDVCMYAQLDE
jgi:hypothetical protein